MITKQLNNNKIAVKDAKPYAYQEGKWCAIFCGSCLFTKKKLLEGWNTAIVGSCSTWQHCSWHSHFHAATIGLPEVWWAALKRSTSSFFLVFELRPFLYLLIFSSKTASVIIILRWSMFRTFVCFMFFTFCCFLELLFLAFKLFTVSFNFSKCFVIKGRMPSGDGVGGIFWMNWWESRLIYLFEGTSFFAIFVSFPWSKLQ